MSVRAPRNTPITWILTIAVLAIGGYRAWGALSPPPAAPTPPSVERTIHVEEDLGDLRQLRWWAVREEVDGQELAPLEGKLTLHFSDQIQQAYPVVEGRVEVQPHRLQLVELCRSQRLGVEWQGHPVRWVLFAWLREYASPEVLEQHAGPTATRAVVRNRSIVPMTVRVRGGWRLDTRWADDPARGESSAGKIDVVIAPGGTEVVEIAYTRGPEGATLSPPIVRPIL